MNLDRRH